MLEIYAEKCFPEYMKHTKKHTLLTNSLNLIENIEKVKSMIKVNQLLLTP